MKKISILIIFVLLIIWHLLSLKINEILLPSPFLVMKRITEIMMSQDFIHTILISLKRMFLGIFFGFFLGSSLAIISGTINIIEEIQKPIIIIFQSMPITSFLLLSLIWFPNTLIPIFVVIIATFPIYYLNILHGIKGVDKNLLEMAHFYHVSKIKIIKNIHIPSIYVSFISANKICLGLAYKVAVMSEVVARTNSGIGAKLSEAWINIETADLLGWTVIIIVITAIIEKTFSLILGYFTRKYI